MIFVHFYLTTGVDPAQIVNVDNIKDQLPKLPEDLREHLINNYGVNLESAITIVVCKIGKKNNNHFIMLQ